MSPVNTMTVLQSDHLVTDANETTSLSVDRKLQEIVKLEGSVGSCGGTDIKVYCEDKLRSLSEGELQTLAEVSEECIAKILGGPIFSERFVNESIRVDVVGDMEEGGHKYLSSTHVKNVSGGLNVVDSSKFPSESPFSRSAGVAFVISEDEEFLYEAAESEKKEERSQMIAMTVK